MSELEQRAIEALNREIDEQGRCTFGWLWPIANVALGHPRHDHNAAGYRFTDRFLQRERRRGALKCERAKGGFVWSRHSTGEAA